MDKDYIKFSDSLVASFAKLYRVGGFALVFIFVGVITMIGGNYFGGPYSGVVVGVGAVATLACLGLFTFAQFQGPIKAARAVQRNKETIDAVQEVSLELTRALAVLQAYTFKHLETVDRVLETAVPILASLPLVGGRLETLGLSNARNVSRAVVEASQSAESIIRNVEEALATADAAKLKQFVHDLESLTAKVRSALAEPGPAK